MLLAELEDFVIRHRACGQLTGDATEPEPNGYMLTVSCFCGVSFLRWLMLEVATRMVVKRRSLMPLARHVLQLVAFEACVDGRIHRV